MEIIGTIKEVFQPQSGTSQRGNAYTTQTILITYGNSQYTKDLALTLMTKQVEQYRAYLTPGLQFKFYIDASSREYNGRYYTECTVWKIESIQVAQQPQQYQAAPMPMAAPPQQFPQQPPQQMPNYGTQYSVPAQPQYQQSPIGQPYGPSADSLPFTLQ